jgi:hypothetical protein
MAIRGASMSEELYDDLQELWGMEKCGEPFKECMKWASNPDYRMSCDNKETACRAKLSPHDFKHTNDTSHKVFWMSQQAFAACMQQNWYNTTNYTNSSGSDWRKKAQVRDACVERYKKVRNEAIGQLEYKKHNYTRNYL